jgi:SAM-dependent methyltransferase
MTKYNKEYFDNYLTVGKYSGKKKGEKSAIYAFWLAYLRKKLKSGAKVLEVGCGLGFFGSKISSYFEYFGIDISDDAIQFAKDELHLENVEVGDANKLKQKNSSIDTVIAFDIIEHLDDPSLLIGEAYRVLQNGGYFIATTPNPESLGNKIKKTEDGLTPSMYLDKTHVSLLTIDTWEKICKDAGFSSVKIGSDSLWDLPYTRKIPLIIQKLVLIPPNILFQRWVGFARWRLGENIVIVAQKK